MSAKPPFTCELLEWDTAFFSIRIGRLHATELGPDDMPAVQAWRREHAVECLYCLLPADDGRSRQTLERHAFQLVDLRLTLAYTSAANPLPTHELPPGVTIQPAQMDDLPALRLLAQNSHGDTRFFRDRHFARERSQALYATWIEKSCRGGADIVLVAVIDGQVAGYCTGEVRGGGHALIGLCAVAAHAQGRGGGQALVNATLRGLRDYDAQFVSVVTQAGNLQAYNLYRRCGFVTEDIALWYHGWFNDQ